MNVLYIHDARVIFWVKVEVRRLYSCITYEIFLVHPDMAVYIRICPNFYKKTEECTISTCPNFQKTEECTMSKPLYSGQGYLNKSEALGLKIY